VSTSSATSSSATVTLSATIQDITAVTGDPAYDGFAGDISKAKVTFVIRNADGTSTSINTTPVSVGLVNTDTKVGTATFNWTVNIGNSNSQTYTIGIVVSGFYTRDASTDVENVTVSKPLNDFITGGGFITLTSASGQIRPKQGTKNNFGFNVKYNKGGTNLQGNINTIVRGEDGKVYQVKGNVMTSLAVDITKTTTHPNPTAIFNGKASIQDITDPTAPVSVDGNATLQVTMTDAGEPGTSDKIAITVWNKAGGVWFASNWNVTKTVEQFLAKGNLKVSSSSSFGTTTPSSTARTSAEPAAAESLEQVQATAYPNPFYDKVTLSFGKEVTEEVVIMVVDMKGAVILTKKLAANSYASEVELDMTAYRSGTYVVQTIIGKNRTVTKVIKQQ
jgi:hypothetical protein